MQATVNGNVMRARLIATAAALLLSSGGAAAHGDGLWAVAAIGYCMAQDDAYAQLPGGRMWARDEGMVRFLKDLTPAQKTCLVARKAGSAQFCTALLTANPNADDSDKELEVLAVKHKQALERLLASCGGASAVID